MLQSYTYRLPLLMAAIPAFACVSSPARASEIDDLKAQVQFLMKRVNELERKLNRTPTAHRSSSQTPHPTPVSAPVATPSPNMPAPEKNPVRSGNEKVRLTLRGHVNRALLYADNGSRTRLFHVDNSSSPTRLSFNGETHLNSQTQIGSNFEVQMESNASSSVSMTKQAKSASDVTFAKRKLELYAKNARYGQLWVGQGETASYGGTETDLSGTAVVGLGANVDAMAGGLLYQTKAGGKTGPQIQETYAGMDGLGRADRIRYDTPTFNGFSMAVSHVDGDSRDAGLRFSGEVNKTQIQAALTAAKQRGQFSQYTATVSTLFTNGISLTGSSGLRHFKLSNKKDSHLLHGKIGYQLNIWDWGKTAFAADIGHVKSLQQNKDAARTYGLMAVQNIDEIATEIYFGLRWHHLKRLETPYKPIFASMLGARVKF